MLEARTVPSALCPQCGTEVAPHLLICPGCHRLIHGDRLKSLAGEADQAEASGDPTVAMIAWRSALELLPPGSRQHEVIRQKVGELVKVVDAIPGPKPKSVDPTAGPKWGGAAVGGVGTIGLMIWKFKFLGLMILGKGKLLLLGLTKASTLLSMFLSFGVYWSLWGWPFAAGLVLSIYIHEMGHVAALVRYGIKAGAPMFIPGLGAVIRAQQHLASTREDARVGLAGPVWGLGAAIACAIAFALTDLPILAGIAKLGAWINLFNLIPIWQLDGGRAFNAFNRSQRWFATLAVSAAWAATEESVLMLVLIGAAYRAGFTAPAAESDQPSVVVYVALIALLSLLTQLPVPMP